jgi:hypothetical protein
MTSTTSQPTSDRASDALFDRPEMPQYSLRQVIGVWVAVTVPMSILSWVITPWLGHRLGGQGPVHRRTSDLLQRRVALDDHAGPHPHTP